MSTECDSPRRFEELDDLVLAYQKSRVVVTAVELDVFSVIADAPQSARAVATACGTDVRATGMLLDALSALGLVTKQGNHYQCTELTGTALNAASPESARAIFLHQNELWSRWSDLTDCVKEGRPAAEADAQNASFDQGTFIGAMHQRSLEQAPAFVQAVDCSGVNDLLDLGGGSGAYAIAFCQEYPEIHATVLDRQGVVNLAADYVQRAGLQNRVETRAGDMFTDDLGGPYDLVWLSNVAHSYRGEDIVRLFRRIRGVLRPAGRFVLRDFIMSEDKTEPEFGAVFALNMLVCTGDGGTYSGSEYREWLKRAGFVAPTFQRVSHAGNTALVVAENP